MSYIERYDSVEYPRAPQRALSSIKKLVIVNF